MKIFKINNEYVYKYESTVSIGNNYPIATGINLTDHEMKYWSKWDEMTNKPILDQARIDADILYETEQAAIEYRRQREIRYVDRISPEKTQITALGDCVDALIEAFVSAGLPLTPKLASIVSIIQQVKTEVPKP